MIKIKLLKLEDPKGDIFLENLDEDTVVYLTSKLHEFNLRTNVNVILDGYGLYIKNRFKSKIFSKKSVLINTILHCENLEEINVWGNLILKNPIKLEKVYVGKNIFFIRVSDRYSYAKKLEIDGKIFSSYFMEIETERKRIKCEKIIIEEVLNDDDFFNFLKKEGYIR